MNNANKTYDELKASNEENLITDFISKGDIENALFKSRRTVNEADLKKFEDWTKEFGIEG